MKIGIRNILSLVLATIFIDQISIAQSFSITPNDTIIAEGIPEQLTIYDIYMDNSLGADTLILNWERVSLNIPGDWDYSLCDLGTCYPGIPDNGTMYPVPPGEMGFLGYNVIPSFSAGITTLVMNVWEDATPEEKVQVVWIVSSGEVTAINSIDDNSIAIYPTITKEDIFIASLNEGSEFSLITLNGNRVLNQNIQPGIITIHIDGLPKGMYLAVVSENGIAVKTQKIIIQ
ncbi:MAG: T9SS type A sorting domain-containing protein [Chitinophagales bacterium]